MHGRHLAALALLDGQRSLLVLAVAGSQEVHLLSTVLALDTECGLAIEGELALVVHAEAVGAGTLGGGTRVRDGKGNGLVGVLDGVQVLPASRGLTLGSVAHLRALGTAPDLYRLVSLTVEGMFWRDLRMRMLYLLVSPPMKALAGI